MNKRGFTLIELLGVIILLAAIALVSFPAILNSLKNSSKKMDETTEKLVFNAAKLYLEDNNYKENNGNVYCISLRTLVDSDYLDEPIIDYQNDSDITDLKSVKATYNNKFSYDLVSSVSCYNHLATVSAPELYAGLVPVNILTDGTVKVANVVNGWYDYSSKLYANAVLVSDTNRENYINSNSGVISYSVGTTIPISDILGYYVWIPRFRYKIFNTGDVISPTLIDVDFELVDTDKSTGISNNEWLTHPAFTSGSKELSGFWVGKFLTNSSDSIKVLPSVSYDINKNIGTIYSDISSMNTSNNVYGLDTSSVTSLLNNDQYAAIAYLSHSKYGYGSRDIKQNFGTSTTNLDSVAISSNSNISGVYDMSGLTYEYVFGLYNIPYSNPNISNLSINSGLESGNIDNYKSNILSYYDSDLRLGSGTLETKDWYYTYVDNISSDTVFLVRGGDGFFSYKFANGDAGNYGYRVSIIKGE